MSSSSSCMAAAEALFCCLRKSSATCTGEGGNTVYPLSAEMYTLQKAACRNLQFCLLNRYLCAVLAHSYAFPWLYM